MSSDGFPGAVWIPAHADRYARRDSRVIEEIVLHITEGGTDKAEITAHNAFNRQRPGFLYDHRTPGELFAERLQFFWELIERCCNKVVRDIVESLEPEGGNLIEHCAFVRKRIGKNHVECRDPVRDDKEQCFAKIEDLAHLAAAQFFDSGKID